MDKKNRQSIKNAVLGIRSVNIIRSNHPSSFQRDSNISFASEFLTSGVSANDLDNVSNSTPALKTGKKNALGVNRGSQVISHSTFLRKNMKNNTYCIVRPVRESISCLKFKEEPQEQFESIVIRNPVTDSNKKEARAQQVKDLLKANFLKEYEQRIKGFLRNEKFFLSETNNLKVNIPFAYFVKPPILSKHSKFQNKDSNKQYGGGGSLTERKERPKSLPKVSSLCNKIFVFL